MKDFEILSEQAITFTCTKIKCNHANGWYKSVVFKLWIFEVKRRYFLCTDCEDLIPYEEAVDIWEITSNKHKGEQTDK